SIRENARRARQAGDQAAARYWDQREATFQEILQRANRAALEYLQEWDNTGPCQAYPGRLD
ncbi:MAG TPA: hypothetical protein VFW50_22590, partial [Streptosporangiaceae bacterium]|nr:hypothetical protein [Streptosporangiaceae bacterium]